MLNSTRYDLKQVRPFLLMKLRLTWTLTLTCLLLPSFVRAENLKLVPYKRCVTNAEVLKQSGYRTNHNANLIIESTTNPKNSLHPDQE